MITLELKYNSTEKFFPIIKNYPIKNIPSNILIKKMYDFSILFSKKKCIGKRRSCAMKIVLIVLVAYLKINYSKRLTSFEKYHSLLNPADININANKFWELFQRCKENGRYIYRFILEGLMFSSSIINGTNQIFLDCSGLNDANKFC